MNKPKRMLIVVDMNNGFAKKGNLYSERIEKLIPNIVEMCDFFKNEKILFITDSHSTNAREFNSFPEHCSNEEESAIIDELIPYTLNNRVVKKNSTNAMNKMNPIDVYSDYDEFVIVGCVTDICVYQLANSMNSYINEYGMDKNVIVVSDCVDTFDIPEVHPAEEYNRFFINSMKMNGIEIKTKEEILK